MQLLIILLLILINGLFAMAEIAIVSVRKSKLRQQAAEGNHNALAALELANTPNRFLSTVQIGITFIGIFAGAFGGDTIAENLSRYLSQFPVVAPYSNGLALFIVVSVITYLSLVIGELVPKRLAMNSPEKIAKLVARPMTYLSAISSPLVNLLSTSTDLILNIFGVQNKEEEPVSEEEVKLLFREGTKAGVFEKAEKDIVERTLRVGDKKISAIMTPRQEVDWIGINTTLEELKTKMENTPHTYYPVCRNDLDTIIGIVHTEDVLKDYLADKKIDLAKSLYKAIFIPESTDVLKVLELFKKSGIHIAIVIDEFGSVQGIVTVNDVLEAIVGDMPSIHELDEQEIIKRDNGTYLVDGLVTLDEFKDYFKIPKLPGDKSGSFHTFGGFVMHRLGKVPSAGDKLDLDQFKLEVIDMDGNRVDKILVIPKKN